MQLVMSRYGLTLEEPNTYRIVGKGDGVCRTKRKIDVK